MINWGLADHQFREYYGFKEVQFRISALASSFFPIKSRTEKRKIQKSPPRNFERFFFLSEWQARDYLITFPFSFPLLKELNGSRHALNFPIFEGTFSTDSLRKYIQKTSSDTLIRLH